MAGIQPMGTKVFWQGRKISRVDYVELIHTGAGRSVIIRGFADQHDVVQKDLEDSALKGKYGVVVVENSEDYHCRLAVKAISFVHKVRVHELIHFIFCGREISPHQTDAVARND